MKIGIIQPRVSYYPGGGEKTQLEYSKHLASAGNNVVIYTLQTPNDKVSYFYKKLIDEHIDNLEVKEFKVPSKYQFIFDQEPGEDRNRWDSESLLFNQLIFNTLEIDKPDIVISCYILDGIFRPTSIPGILHLSGYPVDKLEIRKSFLRFFDATISISNNVKDKWSEYLNEGKNNYVLNKGVDKDVGTGRIDSSYKYNLVFAGRLIERKGVTTLVESMKNLVLKYSNLHLWILGNGPQIEQLSNLIKINQLEKNIDLVGQTDNVYDYYRMADICVFPSYEKEGLMGVVMESMSVGKPVITTTNNGNEDIIKNGKTGMLIEPRNEKQLTQSIDILLSSSDLRLTIGNNAKEYISKNHTWSIATNKLLKILKSEIKRKNG